MNRLATSVLLLLVLVVSVLLSPLYALGQSSEGLQIRPAVIEDRINPGDTYRFTIKVSNISSLEKVLFLGTQNIKGLDEQGQPIFANPEEATKFDLSAWISMPSDSITLKPNESKDVQFVTHVPSDASPGSHFGGIFFDQRPIKQQTTGTGVGIRVGTVLSLRISGDILEEARLREFSTDKLVYDQPKVNFLTRIEDQGNVLMRPHGVIEINDMFGKQISTLRVNDAGAPVFPGQSRSFEVAWEYNGFAFGRYQAIVSLTYGEETKKTVSGTTSFWVLPLKPILAGLGVLLAAILILYMTMRMYIRKQLREMGVSNNKRADADMYGRRYSRNSSRLVMMVVGIFFLCVLILATVFLVFA